MPRTSQFHPPLLNISRRFVTIYRAVSENIPPFRFLMTRSYNNSTATSIIESTIFRQYISSAIEIIYRSFNPTIFDVMSCSIIACSHPCILKRTEVTIIKCDTIRLTAHCQSLRPFLAIHSPVVNIRDVFRIEIRRFNLHYTTIVFIDIRFRIMNRISPIVDICRSSLWFATHIQTVVNDGFIFVLSYQMNECFCLWYK